MASLSFYNGSVLYLDENTKLKIAEFTGAEPGGDQMELQLVDGRIWVEHQAQDGANCRPNGCDESGVYSGFLPRFQSSWQ